MRTLAFLVVTALAVSALPPTQAEPTPGLNLSLTRVVPEPYETNDFISYAEARGMLDQLASMVPAYLEVLEVGQSYGWDNALTGAHDTFGVLAVEVTNEASATPRGQKQAIVFQLSIHGNEKGGREGGLRVIEDLARPLLYGEEYRALLDEVIVVFTFPNVDGWIHEEVPYRLACNGYMPVPLGPLGCLESQSYIRYNGRGVDMNRDWPTVGWYQTDFNREQALSEPEIASLEAYLSQFRGRTLSASDIHGMLNPADGGLKGAPINLVEGGNGEPIHCLPDNPMGLECLRTGHFVLGMIRGYEADAKQMLRDERLAERTKQYLNAMAEEQFPYWTTLPNLGYAGGEFAEYGTVWDTLGYSDSGFTGLWLAQALGAAGLDFELSYNHVTFDNHYVAELNKMHVESVRAIVRGFLDEAAERVAPSLQPDGTIAVLADERAVRADPAALEGPHASNASDDAYERASEASPQRFWDDLARYMPAGGLAKVSAADVAAGRFHGHRTVVISGDAWDLVAGSPEALRHLRMHLDQGGRVVLTDSALRGLEALGLAAEGSVEAGQAYMGYATLKADHAYAKGTRPLARQTYESIPLGYALPDGGPVWTVASDALEGAEVAGWALAEDRASVGRIAVGAGEVVFLGALLPTPTADAYSPYGLADYAVSATGYRLVYNALGIALTEVPGDGPEAVQPTAGPGGFLGVPGPGALAALAVLGLAATALGRRRAPKA